MNFIKKINEIRDIPYKIPLSIHEKSQNCCGKHIELKKYFEKHWLEVRYRVCSFLWSSIHLPEKVKNDWKEAGNRNIELSKEWERQNASILLNIKNIVSERNSLLK